MASLPVEVFLGVYLGLLVGIIPALVSWGLAFSFKYFTGVTVPGFGVTVLAIALAGVNGGLLALADRTITAAPNAERVVTAIIVVSMASMYAHAKGDQMGAEFPRRLSLGKLRERTLSADVVELVGGRREVRVRVVGEIADMEGYPPLPEEVRAEIRAEEWTFPADLHISELESRMEERLRTAFDLGDATVSIDQRGRASVVAAPPFSGLSKRVGGGERAVSVDALLPTGLARGDELTLVTPDATVGGTVLSARSGDGSKPATEQPQTREADANADAEVNGDGEDGTPPRPARAPTTDGGEGRLTAGVARADAEALLRADEATVVVESRGTRREYELVSLLRRAGQRFRRMTVGADGALDGVSLADANVRETYGVAVFALRKADGWLIAPGGETTVQAGEELYAVGTGGALDEFSEVVA